MKLAMMDTVQATVIVLSARTTADESEALQDGVDGLLYRPDTVFVNLESADREHVGTFQIDSDMAVKYQNWEITAEKLGTSVSDSLELSRPSNMGEHSPAWYLNRSELFDFKDTFLANITEQTDPEVSDFEMPIPTDNVQMRPSNMSIHFHIDWDDSKMGLPSPIGDTQIYDSYWRVTQVSEARAPAVVSVYMDDVGDDDTFSSQNRTTVKWLLDGEKSTVRLNTYYNRMTFRIIEDED